MNSCYPAAALRAGNRKTFTEEGRFSAGENKKYLYTGRCFLLRMEMRYPAAGFPALCIPVFAYNGPLVYFFMSISYTV